MVTPAILCIHHFHVKGAVCKMYWHLAVRLHIATNYLSLSKHVGEGGSIWLRVQNLDWLVTPRQLF